MKPYFHELPKEEQKRILNSEMVIKDFMDTYNQPPWCSYPEALMANMGCWSLMGMGSEGAGVVNRDYCKDCDLYKRVD